MPVSSAVYLTYDVNLITEMLGMGSLGPIPSISDYCGVMVCFVVVVYGFVKVLVVFRGV